LPQYILEAAATSLADLATGMTKMRPHNIPEASEARDDNHRRPWVPRAGAFQLHETDEMPQGKTDGSISGIFLEFWQFGWKRLAHLIVPLSLSAWAFWGQRDGRKRRRYGIPGHGAVVCF
jgi:hypothetical protein